MMKRLVLILLLPLASCGDRPPPCPTCGEKAVMSTRIVGAKVADFECPKGHKWTGPVSPP